MIKLRYSSIDGCRMTRTFKTWRGARRFADVWIGPSPDLGATYAVSQDGVGKIEVLEPAGGLRGLYAAAQGPARFQYDEEKVCDGCGERHARYVCQECGKAYCDRCEHLDHMTDEERMHHWQSKAEWESFGKYGRG